MASGRTIAISTAAAVAVLSFVAGVYWVNIGGWLKSGLDATSSGANAQETNLRVVEPTYATSVVLNEKQMASVKVESVGQHDFPLQKIAVGSIDFNEELETQVFTPYQGKIIQAFAKVGDEVKKGQTLFTIDSPDLLNAEASLISAAGVLDQSTRVVERGRELYKAHAISQAELELDISNQITAEGQVRTDATRCASSARPMLRSIRSSRIAGPTQR
jgi:membrane fusion protein, heavy metal efflux system